MISQAEEQAINRLRQLGFSKVEAAQAYFACDKNEELAANLLFDRLANGDIEM
jgi:UV excision repair protein RAD23